MTSTAPTTPTTPVSLQGQHASLVPLTPQHAEDLRAAVADGDLWRLWYTFIPTVAGVDAEIERRLKLHAASSMNPWAVISHAPGPLNGRAVGMTTYMNIDAANRRVEIGSTWYRRSVQRSPLNTECKLMLLRHAFETLNCIAVEFRTHFFNQQSRGAIERLGAKLDGVLRNHQLNTHAEGHNSLRDTAVYSIIASEWPAVKAHLHHQLTRPR